MNKSKLIILVSFTALLYHSCKNENTKSPQENSNTIETETNKDSTVKNLSNTIKKQTITIDYAKQSVNEELAAEIKKFITSSYLSEGDLRVIPEKDRKFQLYQIDLNGDGENEVFVNFMTSYFCGTGGCNLLLLNNKLEVITKFTVLRTPLFAEKSIKNGWNILLTRSGGELKELVYSNDTYPNNPSMVEKAPYDAPSGHAEIMFDDNFSKAKTYSF